MVQWCGVVGEGQWYSSVGWWEMGNGTVVWDGERWAMVQRCGMVEDEQWYSGVGWWERDNGSDDFQQQ